jgi:hypothetical protein
LVLEVQERAQQQLQVLQETTAFSPVELLEPLLHIKVVEVEFTPELLVLVAVELALHHMEVELQVKELMVVQVVRTGLVLVQHLDGVAVVAVDQHQIQMLIT